MSLLVINAMPKNVSDQPLLKRGHLSASCALCAVLLAGWSWELECVRAGCSVRVLSV